MSKKNISAEIHYEMAVGDHSVRVGVFGECVLCGTHANGRRQPQNRYGNFQDDHYNHEDDHRGQRNRDHH